MHVIYAYIYYTYVCHRCKTNLPLQYLAITRPVPGDLGCGHRGPHLRHERLNDGTALAAERLSVSGTAPKVFGSHRDELYGCHWGAKDHGYPLVNQQKTMENHNVCSF